MEVMQPATAASAPPPLLSLLANAADRLDGFPEEAENVARDILLSVPGQQHALALLASARKARGDWAGARSILEAMAAERSNLAAVRFGEQRPKFVVDRGQVRALGRGPLRTWGVARRSGRRSGRHSRVVARRRA